MSDPANPARYQRLLLVFLSLAMFCDGYDLFALSQTLPELRNSFKLTPREGSYLAAVANLGPLAGYFFTRLADRVGRRPILCISLISYPLLSGLSALSPTPVLFVLCQLSCRFFLTSGLTVALIYSAEECAASWRGLAMALLLTSSSLGAVFCAVLTPAVLKTHWGWRGVYLFGMLPLILSLVAPFLLRESTRFASLPRDKRAPRSLLRLLRTKYRTRMFQLALIWAATNMCLQSAVLFWKEHALAGGGMTSQQAGRSIAIAALFAIPATAISGRLIDTFGRRRGALVLYSVTILGIFGAYCLPPGWLLVVALCLCMGGAGGMVSLLHTLTAECFPTELRSDGAAWSTNLLGRLATVVSPLLVAQVVEYLGWARTMCGTCVFLLAALVMIQLWMEETAGKDLEDSA